MRRLHLIIAIFCIALSSGCSLATLAYNNAYTVLCYSLDDYFDLTDEQRDWLKPRTEAFLTWHRSTELPSYQRLLAKTRARAQEPALASDFFVLLDEAQALLARLVDKAMPDMVGFVQQLSPPQLAYLEKKFESDNAKMRREISATLAKRQKLRHTRYVDRMEDWLGPLTEAQHAELQDGLARFTPLDELRLTDRIKRQGEFLRLARQRADDATLARELRVLLLQPERLRGALQQAEWTRQQNEILALIAAVVSTATPAQKARIDKRFASYARDVASLMRVD